jgi:hypothetical protein
VAQEYICTVNQAGPATGTGQTPDPVVQFSLTDTNNAFSNAWFFAAGASKNQMLAVALAAISTQSQVNAWVDPPQAGVGITQCYALYIIAY